MSASRESTPVIVPGGHPGALVRLVDVVVDPRAAFRGIAEQPSWLAAFIAVVVARFVSLFVFYHPDTTPVKLAIGITFQVAMVMPMILASATLLWVSGRAWDVRFPWPTAFSVATHVLVAYTIVTIAVASVAGAMLPASVAVDLREPPFTNLAQLADVVHSPRWARVLAEADVRSAYALVLTAVGIRAAQPMVGRARIIGVVVSCFAARVLAVLLAVANR